MVKSEAVYKSGTSVGEAERTKEQVTGMKAQSWARPAEVVRSSDDVIGNWMGRPGGSRE